MIVLASGSLARGRLLEQAGVTVTIQAPHVDEGLVKRSMAAESAEPAQVAEALAELKAATVGKHHLNAYIIGGDQILDCDGTWLDKPGSVDEARQQLLLLRGRTHRLTSAVAVIGPGRAVWRYSQTANLTMRKFSPAFLEEYLTVMGSAVMATVGGYCLEGLGAQLFSRIEGDYFTILGLPLLPLLGFLRDAGEIPS